MASRHVDTGLAYFANFCHYYLAKQFILHSKNLSFLSRNSTWK